MNGIGMRLKKKKDWRGKVTDGPMTHEIGIRTLDVDYHLFSKMFTVPKVVILSTGREEKVKVQPDVEKFLRERGVEEVHVLKTEEAIAKYKELTQDGTKSVAAMIHTTC